MVGRFDGGEITTDTGGLLLREVEKRTGIDASAGCGADVARIVAGIRQAWPEVRTTLRGDSGFCREELMNCS